jgi:hypothetical protein
VVASVAFADAVQTRRHQQTQVGVVAYRLEFFSPKRNACKCKHNFFLTPVFPPAVVVYEA